MSWKRLSYELVKPLVVGTYSTIYLVNKFVEGGPSVKMAMKAENADVNSESTGYALAIRFSDHLLPICDFGHSKKYKFMILPLLGPNLDQLREEMKAEFSFSTAARLGIQALDAITMLHQIKMLHTRIQPTHFCIGTDHRKNMLYLVGLGHISTFGKKITWNRKAQYAPRPFASKNLASMELDCWFLTLMDLFDRHSLPWNKYKNMTRETIEERKLLLFSAPLGGTSRRGSGMSRVPPEVRNICAIMNKQNFKPVDLRYQLIKYLNRTSVSMQSPYEWEETPEYRACKNIKPDPAVYEKNVQAIAKCTADLLKEYTPPPKATDDE
ncbi:unnamed protein product [Heligmosomoides polygyrus]|uniref:Protein kinase domain-containing protein n=1 Tax=Heligmosomoides polygyrus TaxID=6339 RepID=A0A183GK01_HELPZ|nr:unnamed protein product [Heligmosomoides polygyrus]